MRDITVSKSILVPQMAHFLRAMLNVTVDCSGLRDHRHHV
jgi:hypothetical protein